ncbi:MULTISPECIES: nucleoside/nucleotide kinase family protein [Clostridium]|uniref:guanylate kinase n=1 Tax=Clostridium TaxID=1485 RepID=UPI00069F8E62|nr:guanylate kinase [Clostridium sp. DMHC 10]KOF57442.1 guanylate kinase [Clostridium sp. DMHC 10]MCD2348373.1 guanylate kinase [Clostridium guangxiense]
MGKIFCLMGKSNCGKDTIFKILKNDKTLNLKPVVTYTTRPKRVNETDGVEYFFIDEEKLVNYKNLGKVIEERVYNTVRGKWYYCTIDDGQIQFESENYILITTLEAYENLKKYFGEKNVIPIYIAVDDGMRLERALKREREQRKPEYNELCRRFLADNIDFSEEKLKACNIAYKYENYDLDLCVKKIKNCMTKFIV